MNYDNLVYKYAIRFNKEGRPTHKIHIVGITQTEPPFLDVLATPLDEDIYNFYDDNPEILAISVTAPETHLWNIYFDYFELADACLGIEEAHYERVRQERAPSVEHWEQITKQHKTMDLLEDEE